MGERDRERAGAATPSVVALLTLCTLCTLLALPMAAGGRPAVDVVAPSRAAAEAGFVVVANAANPATSVKKSELVRLFTRKMRAWPGSGIPAAPVDQRDAAPARREFLARVMGKDAAAMSAYWQSQVFVGRTTPPPVKASDAEVLAFVATTAGAVGYVAADAALPEHVKALAVAD